MPTTAEGERQSKRGEREREKVKMSEWKIERFGG